MKKQKGNVDAAPSKRLFLSIIADYDLNRAICELVDNAIDSWYRMGKKEPLAVKIDIDEDQQVIVVEDNAGGIKESELHFIVGPGQTGNRPTDETIGIFGVGTKRAVVALAQDIHIRTRFAGEAGFSLEFDDDWLSNDEWYMPYYIDERIPEGSTIIELHKLRMKVNTHSIGLLKNHLSATYARFIFQSAIIITLNKDVLKPLVFDGKWAYPGQYSPREYAGLLRLPDGKPVEVKVVAGLTTESSPAKGEYGVYFYCNDRLIARALKTFDVGFATGLAGQPHPNISLVRVIVMLKGEADSMPWNSSKSDINAKHRVFVALREWLVRVVKDYASLSRRWEGKWPDEVFSHTSGEIVKVAINNFPETRKSYLPALPVGRPKYEDVVEQINRRAVDLSPWVKGLYEGVVAVDILQKHKKLQQKNRICFLVLDNTLEIAFKEFLVNDSGEAYSDDRLAKLFSNRVDVHREVRRFTDFSEEVWRKINYYYKLRCEIIHKRATIPIDDIYVEDYKKIVVIVLKRLFNLEFREERTVGL